MYVGSVDYLSTRTIISLSKWCKLLYMLLDMMLDKICDFLIGVFFFMVISRCRAVVGQVFMTVTFSAFSFDFL